MGTHCNISMITPDGDTKNIYVHFDGYLDHVGNLLLNSWNTTDKILQLMNFGDIQSLHEYPMVKIIDAEKKSDVRKDKNPFADFTQGNFRKEAYNYLWKNGKWYVTFWGYDSNDKEISRKNITLKTALLNEYKGNETIIPKKHKKITNKSFPKLNVREMF